MTVRTVTGDVTDISGALTANASFTVVPLDTAFGADADTLVLGNPFRVTANGSGAFTFDAEEGYYAIEYQTSRGAKVKNFTIDATGPWGIGRLIGLTGPFTPGAVQQAIDAAAQAVAAAALLGEWRGPWVTATSYGLGDRVQEGGSSYIAIVAHTSGVFSTDLTAERWELFAAKGVSGSGVPGGGTTGQVLTKASATDQDVAWTDPASGGSVAWVDVTGKPAFGTAALSDDADFAAAVHTHVMADVTDLPTFGAGATAGTLAQAVWETGTSTTEAVVSPAKIAAAITALGGGGGGSVAWDDVTSKPANVTSLAGLTLAAGKGLYSTGADTVALFDLTAAGLALLDDADAAAQQTTLGLGSAAVLTAGTAANNAVQLDGDAKLPAVDGSQLTNLPGGGAPYTSTPQTITSAGLLTLAHGLGAIPNEIHVFAKCITADAGFSVNDIAVLNPGINTVGSAARGFSIVLDATNIKLRFSSDANVLSHIQHASGANATLNNARWQIIVRAKL